MYGGINFHGNSKYLVLDYAEYEIEEYLKLPQFYGKLSQKEIFHQMVDAIKECHKIGLTHQDVKPDNFMIQNNVVKLLDFGLASVLFDD